MCLILIAQQVRPDYPLILLANRDEYYVRPTVPLAFWPEAPNVLAGRDLQAGGTWLGMNRRGRLAAVTNFRESQTGRDAGRSRGLLVNDFLTGDLDPGAFGDRVARSSHVYRGFSLILGDLCKPAEIALHYYSNRDRSPLRIATGIHGLSNHLLDTPWPKVQRGKTALEALLQESAELAPESLLALMGDQTPPPDAELPDTGVGLAAERLLSTAFIASTDYGTRSTSLILVRRDGAVTFGERTYPHTGPGTAAVETRWEHFILPS